MGISQQLSSVEALGLGADLWIIASPESSKWALKIDWELNFQLLRASRHQRPQLANELQSVLTETGLAPVKAPSTSQALLIPADLNLPCRWVLGFEGLPAAELTKIWRDLGTPSTRIFLPKNQDSTVFLAQWTASGGGDLQFVLEKLS